MEPSSSCGSTWRYFTVAAYQTDVSQPPSEIAIFGSITGKIAPLGDMVLRKDQNTSEGEKRAENHERIRLNHCKAITDDCLRARRRFAVLHSDKMV